MSMILTIPVRFALHDFALIRMANVNALSVCESSPEQADLERTEHWPTLLSRRLCQWRMVARLVHSGVYRRRCGEGGAPGLERLVE